MRLENNFTLISYFPLNIRIYGLLMAQGAGQGAQGKGHGAMWKKFKVKSKMPHSSLLTPHSSLLSRIKGLLRPELLLILSENLVLELL
jgi:hypothetical protein